MYRDVAVVVVAKNGHHAVAEETVCPMEDEIWLLSKGHFRKLIFF